MFLQRHDLHASAPDLGALHAAHAMLALMLVGATELGAHHARGYGELSTQESAELDDLSARMRECIAIMDAALRTPQA